MYVCKRAQFHAFWPLCGLMICYAMRSWTTDLELHHAVWPPWTESSESMSPDKLFLSSFAPGKRFAHSTMEVAMTRGNCRLGYSRQPLIFLLSPTSLWFSSLTFMLTFLDCRFQEDAPLWSGGVELKAASTTHCSALPSPLYRGSQASRVSNSSTSSHLCVAPVRATLLIPAVIRWRLL